MLRLFVAVNLASEVIERIARELVKLVARGVGAFPTAKHALGRWHGTEFGESAIGEAVLYQSKTLPSGAVYEPLHVLHGAGM